MSTAERRAELRKRVTEWAGSLTPEQAAEAVAEMFMELTYAEAVSFPADARAPYWAGNGEPIVPGQQPYPDEG